MPRPQGRALYIVTDIKKLPSFEVGLVLGTSKLLRDSRLNSYFEFRMEAAIKLFRENSEVVLLGDGEFDNFEMLEWIEANTSWNLVLRTAKSSKVLVEGEKVRVESIAEKDCFVWLEGTDFTGQQYGPINAIVWWEDDYEEPIFLLTNLSDVNEACWQQLLWVTSG